MPNRLVTRVIHVQHHVNASRWVNQGANFAPDMLEAITHYATRHRLEKRAVLDLALRTFFTEYDHLTEHVECLDCAYLHTAPIRSAARRDTPHVIEAG